MTRLREEFLASAALKLIALILSVSGLTWLPSAEAQVLSPTAICPDPTNAESGLIDGAEYVICGPQIFAGRAVLYSHGTVRVTEEPGRIETIIDELVFDELTTLPALTTQLGAVFAVVARSDTGLSDDELAEEELMALAELVNSFVSEELHDTVDFTYLVGASQGGLFTTKLVEERPDIFDGGLAACAPIGSIIKQVNYWGNLLVVLDFFFPELNLTVTNLLLDSPVPEINPVILANWDEGDNFEQQIRMALLANPGIARQIRDVAHVATDPAGVVPLADSILEVETAIFIFEDAIDLLGGNPFDNKRRFYFGSDNDFLLNLRVKRYRGDFAARRELRRRFDTSGALSIPLVTLHTAWDPIVPFWHELLYGAKALLRGSAHLHSPIPVFRYGHCAFMPAEALASFALLILRVEGLALTQEQRVLPNAESQMQFRALGQQLGLDP